MHRFYKRFVHLSVVLSCLTGSIQAATCTASTGLYSAAGTWSCGHIPANGDDIVIPSGVTVTVDMTTALLSNTNFYIFGTLNFQNAAKIKLDCNSSLWVEPPNGNLTGGNGGSKVEYCGDPNAWTGGQTTNGPFMIGSSPLPVHLISFEGAPDGTTIKLDWTTASETDNDYFTVYRSTNGLSFEEIGRVNGSGTTSAMHSYSLIDENPVSGTNYYKLRQTNVNGAYEEFQIIAVENNLPSKGCVLQVMPNPCTEGCTVNFGECSKEAGSVIEVTMIDAQGQRVSSSFQTADANGSFSLHVDESNNLKPGVYVVRAASSRNVYQQKAVLK